MKDYALTTKRGLPKRLALSLFSLPLVNRLAFRLLKPLKRATWRHRLPVIGVVGQLKGSTFYNADRCQIARDLVWDDGLSPADTLALDLAIQLSADASVFLDVGSYTGLFAIAVARENPQIMSYAYEIVPENYLFLWENVARNDLVERVRPMLLGIGETSKPVRVPYSIGAGVLASSIALDSETPQGVAIPVKPLDELFPDLEGRPVLKIDVEGFEYAVFRGGRQFFAKHRPDMICEFLRRAESTIPEVEELLRALGYSFYRITDNGLVAAEHIVPVKHERDWLLTTRSDLSSLRQSA